MQNSQPQDAPTPRRITALDPEQLAAALPGRDRSYRQLGAGAFRGSLLQIPLGSVLIQHEKLAPSMRVESAPPPGFLPFGLFLSSFGEGRLCGVRVDPRHIVQAVGDRWNLQCPDEADFAALLFEREAFLRGVERLARRAVDPEWVEWGVRPTEPRAMGRLRGWLRETVARVSARPELLRQPAVRRRIEASALMRLVDVLTPGGESEERPARPSQRYAAVRRVEEYLEAHPGDVPTIPELCALAGVSQRTLAYAFREHMRTTPVRFLRVHRLNGARRDLRDAEPGAVTVTDVALRWGFTELGRFAVEYRRLFDEAPSATLRRSR